MKSSRDEDEAVARYLSSMQSDRRQADDLPTKWELGVRSGLDENFPVLTERIKDTKTNMSKIKNVPTGEEVKNKPENNDTFTPSVIADEIINAAIAQPTEEETAKKEAYARLLDLRITTTTVVEPEKPAISIDGVGAFALEDIHGLKAKQKSGKTTALKVIASALLAGGMFRVKSELEEPVVCWLDTEQKPADVKLIVDDIKSLTGLSDDYINEHLYLFNLRKESYEVLLDDLKIIIEQVNPQVCIIDGVVDFIADFNNLEYSMTLIQELLFLSAEHHCSIINVLHTNKALDDRNMRGHLGTMLAQKSGTVLECEKNEYGVISIKCSDSRHAPLPVWSLKYEDGHIVDADAEQQAYEEKQNANKEKQRQEKKESEQKRREKAVYDSLRVHGCVMQRKDLISDVKVRLKFRDTTVKDLIKTMIENKKIYQDKKIISLSPQTELFVDDEAGE